MGREELNNRGIQNTIYNLIDGRDFIAADVEARWVCCSLSGVQVCDEGETKKSKRRRD